MNVYIYIYIYTYTYTHHVNKAFFHSGFFEAQEMMQMEGAAGYLTVFMWKHINKRCSG